MKAAESASWRGSAVGARAITGLAAIGIAMAAVSVRVVAPSIAQLARHDVLPAPLATATRPAGRPQGAPLDAAAQSRRIGTLARREQLLEAELGATPEIAGAERSGSQASVRALELRQELSHVRATQAWIEESFVRDWNASNNGPRSY